LSREGVWKEDYWKFCAFAGFVEVMRFGGEWGLGGKELQKE
jgi:hypothetical protein